MGIEPTTEAWEASILPLNYTRDFEPHHTPKPTRCKGRFLFCLKVFRFLIKKFTTGGIKQLISIGAHDNYLHRVRLSNPFFERSAFSTLSAINIALRAVCYL